VHALNDTQDGRHGKDTTILCIAMFINDKKRDYKVFQSKETSNSCDKDVMRTGYTCDPCNKAETIPNTRC